MGGNAFASEGLLTPRMPPAVYGRVLQEVKARLSTVYDVVESPIEAPGKTDYGDVDFLVLEGGGCASVTAEGVAALLGARSFRTTVNSSTVHFAVPWPREEEEKKQQQQQQQQREEGKSEDWQTERDATGALDKVVAGLHLDSSCNDEFSRKDKSTSQDKQISTTSAPLSIVTPDHREKYIQIDVHACPTATSLALTLLLHHHGDLWTILGTVIRPYGLTCTDTGLYLRIAELESWNRHAARFLLSDDPAQILTYLGLEGERYARPFESWDALLEYVGTCRFYDPQRWVQRSQESSNKGGGKGEGEDVVLTAHDRQKKKQRPMFRYWLDVYLPRHHGDGRHLSDLPATGAAYQMTRDEVVEDAKAFFFSSSTSSSSSSCSGDGRTVALKEFEDCKARLLRQMRTERLWSDIRRDLGCDGSELACAMRGLKWEIVTQVDENGSHGEKEEEEEEEEEEDDDDDDTEWTSVQRAFRDGQFDDVRQWATKNWRSVVERQKGREQKSGIDTMI